MTSELSAFASSGPVGRRRAAEPGDLAAGSPLLREPMVFTEGREMLSEVWRWTPAFLRAEIGDVGLLVTTPDADGRFRYEPGRALDGQPSTVASFLDAAASPTARRRCMQQVSLRKDLPQLAARVDFPVGVAPDLFNEVNLWLASPGTVTPLHYDDTHNLFVQVTGAKTFFLFPPESLEALYPGPLNTGAQHLSQVDLFAPDFERHPRARDLRYRVATVRAGEVLLLPAFWWHQVASEDLTVSVNYWWRADVADCLCPGFLRQLTSQAVQRDVDSLAHTFEGAEPGGLARLLDDLGEPRAAAAVREAMAGR